MLSVRKIVRQAVDVTCTALTLMTGFQKNPILMALSGRYGLIRSRFEQGNINYNIIQSDLLDRSTLVDLADVGASYRFVAAPTRSPARLGEDRSTCMRVNWINLSILTIQYDDFFGKGARREQVFLYSISALNCNVINFKKQHVPRGACRPRRGLTMGLFAVEAAMKSAKVVCAMYESSWVASTVSLLFGIVSLVMIFRGIFVTLSLDNLAKYVPRQAQIPYFAPFRFPMIAFDTYAFPPQRKNDILISKGQRFFASGMWMNHWLYIALSISDAALRVCITYVVLEMGAWMLKKQRNFENFLFVCTVLTRLTWITCFVHTLARYNLKILLKVLKKLRRVMRLPYDAMDRFIDASALFLSYKVYAMLISTILYGMLQTRGTTSFMTRQAQPTTTVVGGFADIANFWRNEIVRDMGITCAIVLVIGRFLASMLLCTRYKTLARNRLPQDRYLFVGWDVFVAIEALGIDPSDKDLVQNGAATTNCSFSSLLQQLYAPGPSGLVEFAGDSVFLFDQVDEHTANDSVFAPIALRYLLLDAQAMGSGHSARCNESKRRRSISSTIRSSSRSSARRSPAWTR